MNDGLQERLRSALIEARRIPTQSDVHSAQMADIEFVLEEAADRIDALEAENARLRSDAAGQAAVIAVQKQKLDGLVSGDTSDVAHAFALKLNAADADVARLTTRIEVLKEALRPFAKSGQLVGDRGDEFDFWVYRPAGGDEYGIVGDDLRRARRVFED